MKRFYIIISILTSLSINITAQKSPNLIDQYKNEYRTFKEFIKYSQTIKGDSTIDVKFYYIDIDIGIYTPYVGGRVTCRFEPKIAGLNSLMLSLNSSLTVDSISSPCESFYQNNDVIFINLENEYDPGDLIDLTVSYHGIPVLAGGYKGLRYESHGSGEPIIATLSTPYLAHYWYPCKDGPQDKPDSVYMDITVPNDSISGQPLMAISNGILENVIDNGDTKTWQWRHRYPIVTYYVMAAISNYVYFQDEFNGSSGESFPLDYYVFQEDLNSAQSGVTDLPEVMQFYSGVFGLYPFRNEKYGMTQLGFYGAIENQTNTITNNLSSSWFSTSVHELAHMWFGDMITLADWHHCWLNEGFATYAEALWAEHQGGFQAYKNNMATNEFWNGGTLYLQNAADTFNTFQSIFYSKGAYVVHMLRGVLGDDVFFDALLDYAQDPGFMYQNASTEDLQESFENNTGTDLGYFFEQWIYDEYWPFYYYNFAQNSNNDLNLILYQAQEELFGYRPVFKMPIRVKFNFTTGADTIVTVWNDEQTQNFWFNFDDEVESVEIDPDKWILRKTLYQPNIPVDIADHPVNRAISIFPNPFSKTVNIDPGFETGLIRGAKIMDLSGRTIYHFNIPSGQSKNLRWNGINQQGIKAAPGIYFLELSVGNERVLRKLVLTD